MIAVCVLHLMLSEIESKEVLRFSIVHEQEQATSCGYSAVATLLSLFWNISVSEAELIERIQAPGSDMKPTGTGAGAVTPTGSLTANLQSLAELIHRYGIETKAFRLDYHSLTSILSEFAPILAHYTYPDRHYVLAVHSTGQYITVLDPARGMEVLTDREFRRRWSGVILAAASKSRTKNTTPFTEIRKETEGWIRQFERVSR